MRKIIIGIISGLMAVFPIMAQGAPDQISGALADLSSRVGREIRLDNQTLTTWQWGQETFNDTSLGCPSEGEMYAQVITPGYIFILEYAGVVYEYHTSSDGTNVRLCEQRSTSDPTEAPPIEEQFSNPLCPPPTVESGAYPRSYVVREVQAIGTLTTNRLRQNPSTDAAIITDIPNGAVFTIVNGPECDDEGIVWWQVDYDGISGWTAEAMADERYIVPQNPNPLPNLGIISTENILDLRLLSVLKGNFLEHIAWSPNGMLAVAGDVGLNGVFIYNMLDLTQPFVIEQEATITALDFVPNNQQVLVGTLEGNIRVWNIATTVDTPFVESLFLQTHVSNIEAVVSHPSQPLVASAGFNAQTHVEVDRTNAIVVADSTAVEQEAILPGHSAPVIDLTFSPDGARLASADESGAVMIWDLNQPNSPLITGATAALALDYSTNGQFIAVGKSDATIDLLNPVDGTVITTYTGHLREVTDISFSPDSSLLASVSLDGTLRVWSTQTDSQIAVLDISERGVERVAFSPDGTLIAVTYQPRSVALYGVSAP